MDGAASNGIRIHQRETIRTGRYAMAGAEPMHADRIWFVLHGYGQLAPRFLRPFEGIIPPDTCVVAPEGLSRFYLELPRVDGGHLQRVGATWLTRESRETEITDAHRWLDGVYEAVVGASMLARGIAPTIGVLGFSQGVATAMRWVASGNVQARCFVAWAGGLAQDVNHLVFRDKMSAADLVLVAGDRDGFATEAARAKIRSEFATFHDAPREITFDGEHHLDAMVLAALLAEFPRHA